MSNSCKSCQTWRRQFGLLNSGIQWSTGSEVPMITKHSSWPSSSVYPGARSWLEYSLANCFQELGGQASGLWSGKHRWTLVSLWYLTKQSEKLWICKYFGGSARTKRSGKKSFLVNYFIVNFEFSCQKPKWKKTSIYRIYPRFFKYEMDKIWKVEK